MSRNRFVKGKIYEFVEDHVTYFSEKSITEYSGINYIENSDTTIILGDNPENATSAALVDYYVKVRIFKPISSPPSPPATGASAGITSPGPSVVLTQYNGEYGFDWVDIDPISEEIQRIQDVDISNVEYFYKKGVSVNDLGDIVPKSSDETSAKTVIKENYKFSYSLKPCTNGRIDRPLVLIKPGQKISLSLEVNLPAGGTLTDEKIYLLDDDFYSFEMVNGTKDAINKRTEIKISADKDVVELKIKCLKESPSETKYTILQENSTFGKKGIPVGGFFMMENKVLKLKFRVIALVSDDGDPNAKAKALFDKFKTSKIKEYLNENSLNQASYEVEIENYNEMSNADVDDYFYAFDKTDWTTKKYFANIIKQKPDVDAAGFCKVASWDPVKKECAKISIPTDVIVDDQKDIGLSEKSNAMDAISIAAYKNKLKTKGKVYEGGIIILVDFESSDENTGAYSRTSPLNHNALIVYSTNTESKDTYAHEIGHMLGLPHSFFTEKEKEAYKNSKENIIGNSEPETIAKEGRTIANPDYLPPIDVQIAKSVTDTDYYIREEVYAKKSTILRQLRLSNTYFTAEKNTVQREKTNIENIFRGRPDSVIVAGSGRNTQTKGVYISISNKKITQYTTYITENNVAVRQLNSLIDNNKIKKHQYKMTFKASHYTDILREAKIYYKNVIIQVHSNSLMFKKSTTKNIMDYDITRIVYLANQIRTMRDDLNNY